MDEAQFFPDVLEWSEEMANSGKVTKQFFSSSRESKIVVYYVPTSVPDPGP